MKTIEQLWEEVRNHPDFVTGSLWDIEQVADQAEYFIEDVESIPLDKVREVTESIVRSKKYEIAKIIDTWEYCSYEYCDWSGEKEFSDLLEFELSKN